MSKDLNRELCSRLTGLLDVPLREQLWLKMFGEKLDQVEYDLTHLLRQQLWFKFDSSLQAKLEYWL